MIINEGFKVSITIHLGKNPRKGGRPPRDIIIKNRLGVWRILLDEKLEVTRLESDEEYQSRSINGTVIKI